MKKVKLPISECIPKKHTPKFNPTYKLRPTTKGVTICIRLSCGGDKIVISTGISCLKSEFKDGIIKGNPEATLVLQTYKTNLRTAFHNLQIAKQPINLQRIAKSMTGMEQSNGIPLLFDAMEIYVQKRYLDKGVTIDEKTKTKGIRCFRDLKLWAKECFGSDNIEIGDIKAIHDQEIIKWVKTNTPIRTDGNAHSARYVERMKEFFGYAIQAEWIQKNPFQMFKKKITTKEIISLSKKELLAMEKEDFLKGTTHDLVRDLFVFSSYTGLAYMDLQEVGFKHLKEDQAGVKYLEIPRAKNGRMCVIPLRKKPLELIEKYSFEDKQAKFFKVPTNQCMNDTIKQIAHMVGIRKDLTTHVARKTFGSHLKEDGVDISIISRAMGHSDIGTTMKYYANIQSTTIINAFSQILKNQ